MIKNKYKILVIILLILFIFSTNVFAASDYDLSDYANHIDDKYWCLIYSYTNDNYYLLVTADTTYKYIYSVNLTENENGEFIGNGDFVVSKNITTNPWGSAGNHYIYTFNKDNSKFENKTTYTASTHFSCGENKIIASNINVYKHTDTSVYFSPTGYEYELSPYIANTPEDLATAKYDYLLIMPGTYTSSDSFDFILYRCTTVTVDNDFSYERQGAVYKTTLDWTSPYYQNVTLNFIEQEFWYEIPINDLGIVFSNNERYLYSLQKDGEVLQEFYITVGGLTDEDKEANRLNTLITSTNKTTEAIKEQTEAIKENNETNKNIFQRIGEILSYINPFSENFFGKKLVELILDGLKSLFVPEDGFFQNYFDEIQQWFSDRLGFLWTPFDIIIEVLERILNISFDEPIIKIPDIAEPFTGQKLISQQEYNLNGLLENEILKNVHDIYFVCVDALIVFGLVNLTKKKIEEVFQN